MEHTELILQYMCDPLIRDGTTTNTIPDKPIDCQNFDCDTDVRYGRHESYEFYQRCKQTERNKGLFTANQNLKGNSAKYTRQNPNGNRHGYECPEERAYYPYWRPSQWKDLAYITNDIERCNRVTAESQNVKSKWYCTLPPEFYADPENKLEGNQLYPINKEDCEAWTVQGYPETTTTNEDGQEQTVKTDYTGQWTELPAWGIDKPACVQTEQTRANHLGLIGGRTQYTYQWTVPKDVDASACTLRIRYNITTNEYGAWEAPASVNAGANETQSYKQSESDNGSPRVPNPGNNPANLDMWSKFNIEEAEVKKKVTTREGVEKLVFYNNQNEEAKDGREYVFKNNPQVELIKPSGDLENFPGGFRFKLQLAVNTAQYSRTFQDRAHAFRMRPRPADIEDDAEIRLVTVSGKRGNIVQTFPAHEYFFIPEVASIQKGNYLHFSWTGSNTNPNNNDGQGKQGTDRSNIVPTRIPRYSRKGFDDVPGYSDFKWDEDYEGPNGEPQQRDGETSDPGTSYPAYINKPQGYDIPEAEYEFQPPYGEGLTTLRDNYLPGSLGGLSPSALAKLATGRYAEYDDFGNMEELDDASTSVNMPLLKVTELGCWNYMSTRNHNFSNRDQKGKICVTDNSVESKMIGMNGGEIWTKHGDGLQIWPESVHSVQTIRFSSKEMDDTDLLRVENVKLQEGAMMTLYLRYETKSLHHAKVMHRCLDTDEECDQSGWSEVDDVEWEERDDQNIAVVNHNWQGEYKVVHDANAGAITGIVIGSLVFICAICGVAGWQLKKRWDGGDREIDV